MDQKLDALENLNFQVFNNYFKGAKIEDLMLSFTFPGYDDIELIDNGADMPVTLGNLD